MAVTDEINIKNMKDALLRGSTVLDKIGIPYVLVGGTLLGVIRENDLMGHDGDVDIDVLAEDVPNPEDLLKKIRNLSDATGSIDYHNQYFTITYEYEGQTVNVDIFLVFNKDGKRFRHFWDGDPDKFESASCLVWPEEFYYKEDWGEVDFDGKKYKVPANVEKYLEIMYGEDWRVPKKQWSWPGSAHNHRQYKFIWEK